MITVTAVGKAAHGAATGLIAARRPAVSTVVLGCLGVVIPALAVSAVVLHISNGSTDLTTWWYGGLALAVTMLVPGLLVAGKQRRNPVGWLMLTACLCEALTSAGREYLVYGLLGGTAPGWLWIGWAADSCYVVAIATLPLMLMLFPDGRALGRRSRYFLLLPTVGLWRSAGSATSSPATRHGHPRARTRQPRRAPRAAIASPGPPRRWGRCSCSRRWPRPPLLLVLRLRRAQGEARQQLKWVAWAGTIQLIEIVDRVPAEQPRSRSTRASATHSAVRHRHRRRDPAAPALRHRRRHRPHPRLRRADPARRRASISQRCRHAGRILARAGHPDRGPGLARHRASSPLGLRAGPRCGCSARVDRLVYGERRNPYRVMTQFGRAFRNATTAPTSSPSSSRHVTQALKLPYAAHLRRIRMAYRSPRAACHRRGRGGRCR